MIVFNLVCKSCQFEFEGCFDNSKDYEKTIKSMRDLLSQVS